MQKTSVAILVPGLTSTVGPNPLPLEKRLVRQTEVLGGRKKQGMLCTLIMFPLI